MPFLIHYSFLSIAWLILRSSTYNDQIFPSKAKDKDEQFEREKKRKKSSHNNKGKRTPNRRSQEATDITNLEEDTGEREKEVVGMEPIENNHSPSSSNAAIPTKAVNATNISSSAPISKRSSSRNLSREKSVKKAQSIRGSPKKEQPEITHPHLQGIAHDIFIMEVCYWLSVPVLKFSPA